MDLQRKMLDELMGQNRNLTPKDKPAHRQHWSDEEVCKHYLVKFCPHELFTNTKSDLWHCDKIHDEALKHEYQKSDRKGSYNYEHEFFVYLGKILADLERKIRSGRERLSRSVSKEPSPTPPSEENEAKISALDQKIQDFLQRMEKCGEEGKVDEAQTLMRQVEIMKAEKEALKTSSTHSNSEKRMEVCEICGAFLVVGDTQKRTDSHLEGKQHTGYDMIRKAHEEFKQIAGRNPRRDSRGERDLRDPRDGRDSRDSRDGRDRRDYRRDDDRRDSRGGRDRDHTRDRDRDRDRRRRSRSRSRSKSPDSRRY